MANVITVTRVINNDDVIELVGTIALSGSGVAGGETIDFTRATYPPGFGPPPVTAGPFWASFSGAKAGGNSGFQYEWSPNVPSTQQGNKMQIFGSNGNSPAALAEFTGAYTAPLLAETISFRAMFDKV